MELMELLKLRRTYRRFKQEPISDEIIDEMLTAARYASSAANLQPLSYVVVKSQEKVKEVFEHTKWAGYLPKEEGKPKAAEEPVLFIGIIENENINRGQYCDTDAGLAISNMTLAAWNHGVGSCIIGACDKAELSNMFGLKEEQNERFVQYDEEASIGALEDLQEKIGNDEYRRFEIFGVFNPISISLKEIQKIGNNLEQFEKYLHEIQALDVYYATSNVYRTPEEKLIGIYAIVADVPSVVPTEPYVIMNQIEGVEAWYVMLKKGEAIGYEDFINNLDIKDYYDANHVITVLSEAKIDELLKKYKVEL